MAKATAIALLNELARRKGINVLPKVDLNKYLFPEQLSFVNDPSKFKTAKCSRRAGKTTTCKWDLWKTASENPGTICVYITLTRKMAKRILWKELKNVNRELKTGIDRKMFNNSELIVYFPNGSEIHLCGADTPDEIEKLRGNKFLKVYLDESASFRGTIVDALIEEVLEPALMDLNGTLCMIGTPANKKAGLFYHATNKNISYYDTDGNPKDLSEWSNHYWTVLNNPHIPHAAAYVEKKRKNMGADNPIFIREWMGKDAYDSSSFVYKYNQEKNTYKLSDLPKDEMNYIIAADIGMKDGFALRVIGYTDYSPVIYSIYSFKKSGMIPDEWAMEIKKLYKQYPKAQIIMDCGALGSAIAEGFRRRYELPIIAAEKSEKMSFIELFNGSLINGEIKTLEDDPVIKEWESLQKDARGKEDPRCANDSADTFLYAYRMALQYLYKEKTPTANYGTDDYWNGKAAKMEQEDMDKLEEEQNKEWWDE